MITALLGMLQLDFPWKPQMAQSKGLDEKTGKQKDLQSDYIKIDAPRGQFNMGNSKQRVHKNWENKNSPLWSKNTFFTLRLEHTF